MKYKPHPRYCLACGTREDITRDHVVPKCVMKALELPSPKSNFQPLCAPCNVAKGAAIIDYRPTSDHARLVKWLAQRDVVLDFQRRGAAEPRTYNRSCRPRTA